MASNKLFRDIPPFPEDVATISIRKISLRDLRLEDEPGAQQMLSACRELGFFLLDLQGDELGEIMMAEIDKLFPLSEDILNLPEDVKERYQHDAPRSFLGFKPRGQAKTETGEPDRFEWFNLGQDGLMEIGPLQPLPPLIHQNLDLFKSFLNHGQALLHTINSVIAAQLSLPSDAFTSLQSPSNPSGTVIRMIKAFAVSENEVPRTSMIHHTDFGTITLLANVIGGLQILAPAADASDLSAWRWVRPEPGCLIVNLGDAMVQWTGGLLRSNVHRVNYGPGQQRAVDRYSLAILARPEHNASMKPRIVGANSVAETEDDELTAWEWEVKKAMSLTRGDAVAQSKGGNVNTTSAG